MKPEVTFEKCWNPQPGPSATDEIKAQMYILFFDLMEELPTWARCNVTVVSTYFKQMIMYPESAGKVIIEAATATWKVEQLRTERLDE
jgi:hypothetical protein